MIPSIAGIVIGLAVAMIGIAVAVFSRQVLLQIRKDFQSIFRADPFASANHVLIRIVGVLAVLLGAMMTYLGVSGHLW